MRNVTVVVVFAVLVIATFGSVYFVSSIQGAATSSSTMTSTQTSAFTPTTSVSATATSSTTQASTSYSTSSTSTSITSSTTSNLSTSSTSTSALKNSSVVGTAWFGPESSPSSCGSMSKSGIFSGDGYTTTIYLPTGNPPGANQYPLGSSICILVYLQNLHSQNTSLPSVETVKVTSDNNSASTGLIFYEFSCSAPGSYNGSFGPNSTGWGCVAAWDTSKPFNGILPTASSPDYVYEALVTISMADSNVIQVENSFGFTA